MTAPREAAQDVDALVDLLRSGPLPWTEELRLQLADALVREREEREEDRAWAIIGKGGLCIHSTTNPNCASCANRLLEQRAERAEAERDDWKREAQAAQEAADGLKELLSRAEAQVEALRELAGYVRAHLAGEDADPELQSALAQADEALASLQPPQGEREE